jgi:cardiolipin synthase
VASKGTKALGQVVAGGPIYPVSTVMLTYFKIFTSAREKLYITNPYFIPNESILDALKQAAISGVDVRLLLPYKSDSLIVGAASRFYFPELIRAGVKIYLYKRGFVHAKTLVADGCLSVIGTANMDVRSFDLNFEIMAVIYGSELAAQSEKAFIDDLKECEVVTEEIVNKTGFGKHLGYSIARLISSFL